MSDDEPMRRLATSIADLSGATVGTVVDRLNGIGAEQALPDASLMARLDRLRDAIAEFSNVSGVSISYPYRANRIAESARDELRALGDQVNGIYRKLMTLETRVREIDGRP